MRIKNLVINRGFVRSQSFDVICLKGSVRPPRAILSLISCPGGFALANRIWIDVEGLFRYSKRGQRPSGIRRLEFELQFKLCRALYLLVQSKGRVFFVRHDVAYTLMTSRSSAELKTTSLALRARSALAKVTRALSAGLGKAILLQIEVVVSLTRSMRARADHVARLLKQRWRSRNGGVARCHDLTDHFATTAKPGDVLAAFGAGWLYPISLLVSKSDAPAGLAPSPVDR